MCAEVAIRLDNLHSILCIISEYEWERGQNQSVIPHSLSANVSSSFILKNPNLETLEAPKQLKEETGGEWAHRGPRQRRNHSFDVEDSLMNKEKSHHERLPG